MVLMMVVLLGFAALVVDVGYAYYAHRSLQSSADAAALAGAQELPNATNAEAQRLEGNCLPRHDVGSAASLKMSCRPIWAGSRPAS